MKKGFFEHMYYSIYCWQYTMYKGNTINPRFSAVLFVTMAMFVNCLAIYSFIDNSILPTHLNLLNNDFNFVGFLIVIAAINWIRFGRLSCHTKIMEKYSNDPKNKQRLWFWLVFFYGVLSIPFAIYINYITS